MADANNTEQERRRSSDPQPVEVSRYGNGAKRNAIIQTVAQIGTLLASFSLLVSVIWWASKIDTKQETTTRDVAEIRIDVEEGRQERRELTENQVRIAEALIKASETLERTVLRLDDTRDIAIETRERTAQP